MSTLLFIHSIGESVDIYFKVIADLLLATMKSSVRKDEPDWCTSGHQTKIVAYSVLASLIQVSSGRHGASTFKLIGLLLDDIMPKNQMLKLQASRTYHLSVLPPAVTYGVDKQ